MKLATLTFEEESMVVTSFSHHFPCFGNLNLGIHFHELVTQKSENWVWINPRQEHFVPIVDQFL